MHDRCPHCLSEVAPDEPKRNLHFACGSERVGDKVYRAPGCYEIREGKLELLLQEISSIPAPATDSDAWETVRQVSEILNSSDLLGT